MDDKPGWETVTALITVKAYPVIGRKTGESVCVAGVRLDRPEREFVRLFPVPFRELATENQFKKYAFVQVRAQKGMTSDRRPESLRPDLSSLRVGEVVPTARRWHDRWDLLDPLAGATTACRLAAAAKVSGQDAPSLGLVKPREILDVTVADNPDYKKATGLGDMPEADLFGNVLTPLEATPFIAKYRYYCEDCTGNPHHQSIIDWEAGQLGRRLLREHRTAEQARAAIRTRFLDEMASPTKDTHFYLGNQHQYPGSFMVLGVFWPPAGSRPLPGLF
ncbi:hypothetical protein [Cellulosimicrobium sp. I38E]|uniref:hypothetical protein n=1 Tax=Cellulosimicrobium sp. I38E TaxID=1393139 RepID=UPI0007B1B95C|nr:hypothetical protein [Cellulosimicrobium sp. I38E]KZM78368.1 hypothetical protein A0J59_13630 [Cellulosimicrobium sp. I38E]